MIIEKQTINGITYGIWHLTESVEELQALINNRFEVDLNGLSNPTRQKERLAARLLLENLCGEPPVVGYHANGEPFLNGSTHCISISHTKNYVAVAMAPHRVGIDIEYPSNRVLRITSKFLNATEIIFLQHTPDAQGTALLFWCAKEVLYKKLPHNEPDFMQFTCLFTANSLSLTYQNKEYALWHKSTPQYTLVIG